MKAGEHEYTWNGKDYQGKRVRKGVYFAKFSVGKESKIIKVIKTD
jgi:flagellar hook assembly protein FlgD